MQSRISFLVMAVLVTACSAQLRTPAVPPAPRQVAVADPSPLFFIDGEEIQAVDVRMIDPASIATVESLKGPAALMLYGSRARLGVVQIATNRTDRMTSTATLFLLDGREIPAALVRALDASKIDSVEVVKGASTLLYGERARGGVVLITSKASQGQRSLN